MLHHRPFGVVTLASLLVILADPHARAEMGGEAGRPARYEGRLDRGEGEGCKVSIGLERVAFLLTSVAGKYRFVRVLVDCRGGSPLTLSSTEDRLDLLVGERSVTAVLSLQRNDPELWDGLDASLRQNLAYPPSIPPGEPVYVFAYFPVAAVGTPPRQFSYRIASLGQEVTLEQRVAAARR